MIQSQLLWKHREVRMRTAWINDPCEDMIEYEYNFVSLSSSRRDEDLN